MVSTFLTNVRNYSFFITWVGFIHISVLPLHLLSPPSSEHHTLFPSKDHSHHASCPDPAVVFSQMASLIFLSCIYTTQKDATLTHGKTQNKLHLIKMLLILVARQAYTVGFFPVCCETSKLPQLQSSSFQPLGLT